MSSSTRRSSFTCGRRAMSHRVKTVSRREMLCRCANGFGGLALASLLAERDAAAAESPLEPRAPHYAPKAKSVIFLFMDGGPSQMDTFDPKPRLRQDHG